MRRQQLMVWSMLALVNVTNAHAGKGKHKAKEMAKIEAWFETLDRVEKRVERDRIPEGHPTLSAPSETAKASAAPEEARVDAYEAYREARVKAQFEAYRAGPEFQALQKQRAEKRAEKDQIPEVHPALSAPSEPVNVSAAPASASARPAFNPFQKRASALGVGPTEEKASSEKLGPIGASQGVAHQPSLKDFKQGRGEELKREKLQHEEALRKAEAKISEAKGHIDASNYSLNAAQQRRDSILEARRSLDSHRSRLGEIKSDIKRVKEEIEREGGREESYQRSNSSSSSSSIMEPYHEAGVPVNNEPPGFFRSVYNMFSGRDDAKKYERSDDAKKYERSYDAKKYERSYDAKKYERSYDERSRYYERSRDERSYRDTSRLSDLKQKLWNREQEKLIVEDKIQRAEALASQSLQSAEDELNKRSWENSQAKRALEDGERARTSAQERLRFLDEELHTWEGLATRYSATQVRTILKTANEAVQKEIPAWKSRFFTVEKKSAASPDENRDAFSVREVDGKLRIGLADGSSQGPLTGPWAQLIAHAFTGKLHEVNPEVAKSDLPRASQEGSLKRWLEPLNQEWTKLSTMLPPMAQLNLKKNGGMATLLGVELSPAQGGKWDMSAVAAGDTNLFVMRKGELLPSWPWPILKAEDFDSSPNALSVHLDKNFDKDWLTRKATLEPGDELFLTTDAVSKWVLEGNPKERLTRLSKLRGRDEFVKLIDKARKDGLVDDDSSLAHFVVPTAPVKE